MNIKFLWCWCIFSLLSITSAFSTSQESEILFIDGVKWDMLAQPIDIDSIHNTKFREFLPKSDIGRLQTGTDIQESGK